MSKRGVIKKFIPHNGNSTTTLLELREEIESAITKSSEKIVVRYGPNSMMISTPGAKCRESFSMETTFPGGNREGDSHSGAGFEG